MVCNHFVIFFGRRTILDRKDKKEKKLRSPESNVSLLDNEVEKEENIDITEKYAELFEKIDVENDYDDIIAEYEKTLEQRAQSTIKKVNGELDGQQDSTEETTETESGETSAESAEQEEADIGTASAMYSAIESLGLAFGNGVSRFMRKPKRFMRWTLSFFRSIIRFLWLGVIKVFHIVTHTFVEQMHALRNDVRSAFSYLKRSKNSPATYFAVLVHYLKKGVVRHKPLIKTVANFALPAAAVIVFAVTVNYWSSVTFALKVNYNNKEIGYITDESVYNEARAAAKERIETGRDGSEVTLDEPSYELSLVSLNQLVDSSVLCDRIIENSGDDVTNACGIYIDDEFVCAIKNETDATSVFHAILEPYEKQIKDDNSFVDFVEKVEYVQGLYLDDEETMWDASKLAEQLSTTKEAAVTYTVKEGDTVYGIAIDHGLTESQLIALNPDMGEYIHEGDELIISNEVNYVRVKLMKTETRKVEVDYETEKVSNSSMFKGTKRTVREGEKGEETVTELVTYIDGKRISAQEISRVRTKEPVNAKVQVGTKPTTVGGSSYNVSVSNSGFVWPAPACTYVSSYYGWRTLRGYADFHTGVDLTKPGGGSTGAIIVASLDGTVESVQRSYSGYGHSIVINHGGGLKTRYAHCLQGSISVSVGQKVSAGQAIARVGSTGNVTGPHLHFEIIINGNQVNPLPYIR